MFWLVVIAMVSVAIVDECLIRRTVTHEEKGNNSADILTEESGIARHRSRLSGFDEGKERILRALQAHYYFAGSSHPALDYGEREVAKVEIEPKVA